MRISDWSSDVCSSDLSADVHGRVCNPDRTATSTTGGSCQIDSIRCRLISIDKMRLQPKSSSHIETWNGCADNAGAAAFPIDTLVEQIRMGRRSEEHTSELQSLMRISHAVFFLKKNNK